MAETFFDSRGVSVAGCLRLLALTHPISFVFFFLLLLLKIYDLLSVKNWDNVVLLSSPPS